MNTQTQLNRKTIFFLNAGTTAETGKASATKHKRIATTLLRGYASKNIFSGSRCPRNFERIESQ
jgi:hypothetical protein